MQITITKRGRSQQVAVKRADGSSARFSIPGKGPVPHDAVHFAVEQGLGLPNGFWGSVAKGEAPYDLQERAKAGGHASAKRAAAPDPGIVELLQAERLVECFEAESWSESTDDAGLLAMADAGWRSSQVPPIPLENAQIEAIRSVILAMKRQWMSLEDGGSLELQWNLKE